MVLAHAKHRVVDLVVAHEIPSVGCRFTADVAATTAKRKRKVTKTTLNEKGYIVTEEVSHTYIEQHIQMRVYVFMCRIMKE
jgi:hypothetical protein